VDQPAECPPLLTVVGQNQNKCCQLDIPDSRQQALIDRFARDQGIGDVVKVSPLPLVGLQTPRSFESDHSHALPIPAASLQSLYCTFLI
jgi:hypothetical protein